MRTGRRIWGTAIALALAGLAPAGASAEVGLREVGDFARPVYVTGAPGDSERLYVVEQRGTVQVVQDGVAQTFLDVRDAVRGPDDVPAGTEEGLLSIAFAPDFQVSRRLYAYFTDATGNFNRVDELIAPTGDAADPTSRRRVIAIPHADGTHHNGGQIQFGPDGMLYVATGDGGTGGKPARDLRSLLGKVLRIKPTSEPYSRYATTGNPFAGSASRRAEIWAYGLRNPFRFSFDRLTGDMTIGDVGEKAVEEIDHLPFAKGLGAAADLGWSACEGRFLTGTPRACPLLGAVAPAIERTHADGYRAIVNGYVVRDPSLPSLYGRLVYGDFYVDALRSAVLRAGSALDDREVGPLARVHRITSFGEDAGGCVYATSFGGKVYRLVEDDHRIPCAATTPDPPHDDSPLEVDTRIPRAQRLLRRDDVAAYVRCNESCTIRAGGLLWVGGTRYFLHGARRTIAADNWGRIQAPLTKAGRRALRKALDRGGRAHADLRLAISGTGGPWTQRVVRVRAQR